MTGCPKCDGILEIVDAIEYDDDAESFKEFYRCQSCGAEDTYTVIHGEPMGWESDREGGL